MEKLSFNIFINAPCDKVWKVLWGNATYPVWTAPFSEGSHAVTDWKKGSKVLFLNGKNRGIISTIVENRPNEFMSFKHLGEVKNGVESAYSNEYPDFLESYSLSSDNKKTSLLIEMNIPDGLNNYMQKVWPKALAVLKIIAEK